MRNSRLQLFFIQACQGDKLDGGISMRATTETDSNSSMSYSIPVHADFLIAYSTIPGEFAMNTVFIVSIARSSSVSRPGERFFCMHVGIEFAAQREKVADGSHRRVLTVNILFIH